jgi:hypothetical protein
MVLPPKNKKAVSQKTGNGRAIEQISSGSFPYAGITLVRS